MDLDPANLSRILGTELPRGVDTVSGVTHDSRAVRPGFAFVAVPGFRHDGALFAAEALRRGAALIIAERPIEGVPTAVVPDARGALAALALAVHGDPSAGLAVHGITGTNGKTTTSYVLHAVLSGALGEDKCGLMGTAETIIGAERHPAVRTTPEAPEVQATLAEMLRAGVGHVVMEVSSHGVALARVTGTRFAGALFTNLTRDHLDLHGTMEEYFAAKRELFLWTQGPKLANADDPWGLRLASEVEDVMTFGEAEGADYRVEGVEATGGGTRFSLRHAGGVLELQSPLLGAYNVLNVAGAAGLALATGVEPGAVIGAVRGMGQVPGRFERVVAARLFGFEVVVDYAHTDVGLEAVLRVARGVAAGRVICVFGAAGDRDGAKRPGMGRVASRLADRGIVTTDDAYTEDPGKIAREVAAGADPSRTEVELDRRAAIRRALLMAGAGDVVVVAGKGHETVQHLPEGDVPFHDATVVEELLAEMRDQGD
ncbi:MAG: UDP-N-acetylmuramoylalanyl-D-glutamate--L-lysine ligase [uncultured Rubrobacteraceae bacterium]|uniref:UDP-N-acetylmuramyl-tripeptide synthetase n=1 Tax=uncultured Rubrobacteraceae bacterium TaxID=349277 RepID=A0A6J4RRG8_9ACTN|nr:MAG: UDP-N-acetylmuramoylalanyl-D-glutamate--L-lysine ligase [uncultured Rubrobacteraceae bacterium]